MNDIKQYLDDLPPDLTRCVGRVLSQCVGADQALSIGELAKYCSLNGYKNTYHFKRLIRQAIHTLRNDGMMICSTSSGKGYWIAANDEEAQLVIRELRARAYDMLETSKALERSADQAFEKMPLRMF